MSGDSVGTDEKIAMAEHPFPGLRPFRTRESGIFFGRRQQ